MSDEEFVKRIGQIYNNLLKIQKDEDYVINQPQMEKFCDIYGFLLETVKKCGGKVDKSVLVPREECGGINAYFTVLDIWGQNVKKFCDVMQHASAFSVDASNDGICLSITVPNVFVLAEK